MHTRWLGEAAWWLVVGVVLWLSPGPVSASGGGRLELDFQSDTRFSHYNFTPLQVPYDAVDTWSELRASLWIDRARSFGVYGSVMPVYADSSPFWWQRYVQALTGLQWYPLARLEGGSAALLRPLRLFGLAAGRRYLNDAEAGDGQHADLQAGLDYYYDNLFDGCRPTVIVWTNAGLRATNFSAADYRAVLWTGNVKLGPKLPIRSALLLGYGTVDWTWVPGHPERWWENFVRAGGGIRWYLKTDEAGGLLFDAIRRFHLYGEAVYNLRWLGSSPDRPVKPFDLRLGVSFATGGLVPS